MSLIFNNRMKKCEHCGKKQKELNADCVFNEWLCDTCYSKYDWHTNGFEAIELHDKVAMLSILK